MKSVLISIRPEWCALIAIGEKTLEIRKNKPKLETPFKCYIYCTKPGTTNADEILETHGVNGKIRKCNGKVIGEFVCDKIEYLGNVATDKWEYLCGDKHEQHKRMVTEQACLTENEMLAYGGNFGWYISDLAIYDKPKKLSEFKGQCGNKPLALKRPPQSWCYVEKMLGGNET